MLKQLARANLPYTGAASNAIWIQVVLLAMDLTTSARCHNQRPRRNGWASGRGARVTQQRPVRELARWFLAG